MPLTQEQFQKARSAGFSTEQIIGFEKKRLSEGGTTTIEETPIETKSTHPFLPRQTQVEEEIKARRNPFEVLLEEGRKKPEPFKHPLSTLMQPFAFGMKALDIPRRMIESPIASAGLAAQRGELFTPQAGKEIIQGFTGERVAELGDIPYAAGVPKPISSAIGLLSLAGITSPKATFKTGKRIITEPITVAKELGEEIATPFKVVKRMGEVISKGIHGKKFMKFQAQNVKTLADGLDDSLGQLYQNLYKTQGIGDLDIDPIQVTKILQKHNIPQELIDNIITQSGGANTISKAQGTLQILGKNINDPVWKGFGKGGEFNPKIAAKNAWTEIKSLMRARAKETNPEIGNMLENLDKLAHDEIYPTIQKFQSIAGKEIKPKTSTILDIFYGGRKGLGKIREQEIIEETPENIKKMGQYLKSQEFTQDLDKLMQTAVNLSKAMKSFGRREFQKKAIGTGLLLGGGYNVIKRFLGNQ